MQIQIRKRNLELTAELGGHIERRLQFSLGRFGGRLRSAVVHLEDLNGPKGGVDQLCKLTIQTDWHCQIVIEERDADIFAAIARAAERAGRAMERQTALRYGSERPRPTRVHFGD
jgi:putative sigma-54 modulation protein